MGSQAVRLGVKGVVRERAIGTLELTSGRNRAALTSTAFQECSIAYIAVRLGVKGVVRERAIGTLELTSGRNRAALTSTAFQECSIAHIAVS